VAFAYPTQRVLVDAAGSASWNTGS
jgi:hypothetical protein